MHSVSCSRNIARIKPGSSVKHCGICGGCLFRRLSLRAADVPFASTEPYVWQDLGARTLSDAVLPSHRDVCPTTNTDEDIATYALFALKHLADFATEADPEVLRVAAAELADAVGEPPLMILDRLRNLVNAHHNEWRSFAEAFPPGGWAHQRALGT